MKKIFLILLLCLFSSSVNAGLKEIGSSYVSQETKDKINAQLENRPANIKEILYFYTDGERNEVWERGGANEITDKLHEEVFKRCNKQIKKYVKKKGECSLYVLDNKVVWDFIKAKVISEEQTVKNVVIPYLEQEKQLSYLDPKDQKSNRSIIDRPDANDDHQVHFIYAILKNGKDKELDINGYIEKKALKVNKNFLKWSAKNKKSNGIGQKFKYDFSKDGKVDVSFARLNLTRKEINKPDYPAGIIYNELFKQGFNNPKKVYAIFTGFKSKHGNSDGGEGGPLFTILYGPAIKSYGSRNMEIIILHELFHTQGAAYGCGKRTYKGAHVKGSDILGSGDVSTSMDSKNNTYYKHSIEGCPDLADSIFLTPTSENPWDPYEVFCKKNIGEFTHEKFMAPGENGIDRCKNQRLIDSM